MVLCGLHMLAGLQPCSRGQCSWAAGELRQAFLSAESSLLVDVLGLEPAHARVQSLRDQIRAILCDKARTCGSSDPTAVPEHCLGKGLCVGPACRPCPHIQCCLVPKSCRPWANVQRPRLPKRWSVARRRWSVARRPRCHSLCQERRPLSGAARLLTQELGSGRSAPLWAGRVPVLVAVQAALHVPSCWDCGLCSPGRRRVRLSVVSRVLTA